MGRESALVSADWAEGHIGAPGVVFVETGNSDAEYRKGHIPGTVWINWSEFQDDLRLGVIGQEKFERLLSRKGIDNDDTVVLYSVDANLLASLAYWFLKLYGHRSVRLLDGGRRKWQAESRPVTREVPERPVTHYRVKEVNTEVRAMRDDVLASIGSRNIIDVRTPQEYSGRQFAPGFAGAAFAPGNDPHEVAQRPGHVPGAVNLPWEAVVNPDGTFRSDDELAQLYSGLDASAGTVTYCWVGARSAHTWFVLSELLGWPDVRNYDGSWAEYGSLIGVPIARGSAPR